MCDAMSLIVVQNADVEMAEHWKKEAERWEDKVRKSEEHLQKLESEIKGEQHEGELGAIVRITTRCYCRLEYVHKIGIIQCVSARFVAMEGYTGM